MQKDLKDKEIKEVDFEIVDKPQEVIKSSFIKGKSVIEKGKHVII
jgi:hypothetical protein